MFSASNGGRQNVRRLAIVFWDGTPKADFEQVIQNAIKIRQFGVHVIAVGVGTLPGDSFGLAAVASQPSADSVFIVPSAANLSLIRDSVVMATCNGMNVDTSQGSGPSYHWIDRQTCASTLQIRLEQLL